MITKAIVEEVIDNYSIRVRIPSIDRTYQSSVHVNKDNLDIAVVCTLPGCDPNIQPGDIVIVSSDDAEEDLIILGHLYRSKKTETYVNIILSTLDVLNKVSLPVDTSIGKVSSFELRQLQGIKSNIQFQLDQINSDLESLKRRISTTGENL